MEGKDKINNRKGLKNILIVRFSAITDVVLTIPVIYSACRCYPDINFYLVTRRSMVPIFINSPKNLTVIGLDLKSEYRGTFSMRRLLNDMRRKYAIDAIVDLQNNGKSRMLRLVGKILGISTACFNDVQGRKRALIRKNNKVMLPLTSMIARYSEAFFRLGLPIQEMFNGIYGSRKADVSLFAEITSPKGIDEKWIGIAPFAKHKGKIYPISLMEKVVADLSQITHAKIFLFGSEDEQHVLGEWAKKYERVISIADRRYDFPIELALMSHIDVMLSMDSANMHLASLVGTTVVCVWGATHPYCGFQGWRQLESNAIQLPMTCRPCSMYGDKPCVRGDYHCLAAIPSQVIIDKVRTLIIQDYE